MDALHDLIVSCIGPMVTYHGTNCQRSLVCCFTILGRSWITRNIALRHFLDQRREKKEESGVSSRTEQNELRSAGIRMPHVVPAFAAQRMF